MCAVCGQRFCPVGCPEYDPADDPDVVGWCEICGEPLYRDGEQYCLSCLESIESAEDAEDIVFDADKHQYTVNGEIVPCVSDIVSCFGKDLDEGDDLELVMDAAADRGTTCHKVLEMLLKGEEPEYPSIYEPYVEAIRLFMAEHTIVPFAIETPIYSAVYGYAGTPDLLCMFDGILTVVDYKFVSQIAKTKVKAQINAYCKAYEEKDIFPDQLLAVQFMKDGTYRIYPVKYDDTELEVALKLRELKHKKHPRGKIA